VTPVEKRAIRVNYNVEKWASVPYNGLILSLDLSLRRTGYTIGGVESGIYYIGSEKFSNQKKDKGLDKAIRYHRFMHWLTEKICKYSPSIVVYEEPIHNHLGNAARAVSWGLVTRVQEYCAVREINYIGVHNSSIKALAYSGRADKSDMKIAASLYCDKYDPNLDDGGDQADSIILFKYAVEHIKVARSL